MTKILLLLSIFFSTLTYAQDGLLNLDDLAAEKAKFEEQKKQDAAKKADLEKIRKEKEAAELARIREEASNNETKVTKKSAEELKKTLKRPEKPTSLTEESSEDLQLSEPTNYLALALRYGGILLILAVVILKNRDKFNFAVSTKAKSKTKNKTKKTEKKSLSKTQPPTSTPPPNQVVANSSSFTEEKEAETATPGVPRAPKKPSLSITPNTPGTPQSNAPAVAIGSDDYVKENTALDAKGRNPSGIVIDEDKYFDGDASSFVDEDFQK